MIKYFVRTTGERALDESFSQIDYELLLDTEHKPVKSFIEQLEYLGNLDCDAVLLEDDLILCKDFKNRIEEAISNYSNKIINFFTYPQKYFKTDESRLFMFNQCTYYPKGISKSIATEMKKITNCKQYDVMEDVALNKLRLTHIRYRPCLVQHIDNGSLIGNTSVNRNTPYFIDYLDELGMSYEDAIKTENKEKLMALMESHLLTKK